MFISIIMRLKSDGSATSLRWKFVVSLSFSEKQMEKQTNKKNKPIKQQWFWWEKNAPDILGLPLLLI